MSNLQKKRYVTLEWPQNCKNKENIRMLDVTHWKSVTCLSSSTGVKILSCLTSPSRHAVSGDVQYIDPATHQDHSLTTVTDTGQNKVSLYQHRMQYIEVIINTYFITK